ncbi:hypothetical protein L484_022667 [Morus notabilis]|uniref:Uncharacterized protein n=1 Tax=Morus notabilis TaxID=981085 RepID=W9QXL5_9ROSA|nr:hypothetical protein L484_022667 [Morus notabilis]
MGCFLFFLAVLGRSPELKNPRVAFATPPPPRHSTLPQWYAAVLSPAQPEGCVRSSIVPAAVDAAAGHDEVRPFFFFLSLCGAMAAAVPHPAAARRPRLVRRHDPTAAPLIPQRRRPRLPPAIIFSEKRKTKERKEEKNFPETKGISFN